MSNETESRKAFEHTHKKPLAFVFNPKTNEYQHRRNISNSDHVNEYNATWAGWQSRDAEVGGLKLRIDQLDSLVRSYKRKYCYAGIYGDKLKTEIDWIKLNNSIEKATIDLTGLIKEWS